MTSAYIEFDGEIAQGSFDQLFPKSDEFFSLFNPAVAEVWLYVLPEPTPENVDKDNQWMNLHENFYRPMSEEFKCRIGC